MHDNQKSWLNDYFSLSIILMLGGALGSFLSLSNSQTITQEKVLTQSTTIVFIYMLLIAVLFGCRKIVSLRDQD